MAKNSESVQSVFNKSIGTITKKIKSSFKFGKRGSEIKSHNTIYKYKSVHLNINPHNDTNILFDFLIDGYIRSECNKTNAQLFPISIKEIIESYYNEDNTKNRSILRSFIDTKSEKIQIKKRLNVKAKQMKEDFTNYWKPTTINNKIILTLIICFILLASITSITAMIIGFIVHKSESNDCADNYSIIDPVLFTIIGGLVTVSHIVLLSIRHIIATLSIRKHKHEAVPTEIDDLDEIVTSIKNCHIFLYLSGEISTWIMMLFYCVWSIIGFCIFHNEMSSQCKQSTIGQIMISWSVIIFIQTFCYYMWYAIQSWIDIQPKSYKHNVYTRYSTWNVNEKKEIEDILSKQSKQRFAMIYPFGVISIIAMIIGITSYHNNNNACDNDYFIIDPHTLILVGGVVASLHIVWVFVCPFIESFAVLKKNETTQHVLHVFNVLSSMFLSIFYLIWTIFGFYIYTNEMTAACKARGVGAVMITWSILIFCGNLLWWFRTYILVDTRYSQYALHFLILYPIAAIYIGLTIPSLYAYYGPTETGNVCDEGDYVLFDPSHFAVIGTIISSAHIIWIFIWSFAIYIENEKINNCVFGMNYILFLIASMFYLFWSIMGFYSYHNEMSSQCKHNTVGSVMIAWCILTFIGIFSFWLILCIITHSKDERLRKISYNGLVGSSMSALLIGIMVVSIYNHYGTDIYCNDNYSLITASHFTLIGSIVSIVHIIILWVVHVHFVVLSNSSESVCDSFLFMSWIITLFYIIWAILGFYIYDNEMSSDCKKNEMGILMITWCVIVFITSCLYHHVCLGTFKQEPNHVMMSVCTNMLFLPSIAVMWIGATAFYGEVDVCKHDDYSVVDVALFTMVFGIVTTLHLLWRMLLPVCFVVVECFVIGCDIVIGCLMFLFYSTWCIIGFYIYDQEMTKTCKQSLLGEIMIAWCIIYFVWGICATSTPYAMCIEKYW